MWVSGSYMCRTPLFGSASTHQRIDLAASHRGLSPRNAALLTGSAVQFLFMADASFGGFAECRRHSGR